MTFVQRPQKNVNTENVFEFLEKHFFDILQGEDNTEYFLGLTPSGIIVLRNKIKVGNYFW